MQDNDKTDKENGKAESFTVLKEGATLGGGRAFTVETDSPGALYAFMSFWSNIDASERGKIWSVMCDCMRDARRLGLCRMTFIDD